MSRIAIQQSLDGDRAALGVRAGGHLDLIFRTLHGLPGATVNPRWFRLLTREAHPMGNAALLADAGDPACVRAAALPLVEAGVPACVIAPRGIATAAADAWAAMGFAADSMPAMAVEIARLAPTALPAGYTFARVGAAGAGGWVDAFTAGYGIPPGLARIFSPAVHDPQAAPDAPMRFYAAYRDGRTIATTTLYLADGLAGIYCVATLPEERGKGIAAHLTAEALRLAAREDGYRVGVLQSSPMGHSVYLALGFEDVAAVPMFVRIPG